MPAKTAKAKSEPAGTTDHPAPPKTVPEAPLPAPSTPPVVENMEAKIRSLLLGGTAEEGAAGQEPSPPAAPPTDTASSPDSQTLAEPAEAEAEPAADETAQAPPPEEPGKDDPERAWPDSAKRRVDKLTAQKAELKDELETLKARLADLESKQDSEPPAAAPRDLPLATVKTEAELDQREDEALRIGDWVVEMRRQARRDPRSVAKILAHHKVIETDGANADTEDHEIRETVMEALDSIAHNADKTLRVHIPKRRQWLQLQSEADRKASELFPWWAQRSSQEFQLASQITRARPEILNWPDSKLALGIYVLGFQALQARQQKPKNGDHKPASIPPAPRVAAKPPAALPQKPGDQELQLSSARGKLLDRRNPDGALDYIRAHLGHVEV